MQEAGSLVTRGMDDPATVSLKKLESGVQGRSKRHTFWGRWRDTHWLAGWLAGFFLLAPLASLPIQKLGKGMGENDRKEKEVGQQKGKLGEGKGEEGRENEKEERKKINCTHKAQTHVPLLFPLSAKS